MRVKSRSHKFVLHKFFIALYIIMHEMLEYKPRKLIERPVLVNLHNFVTRIKISLYSIPLLHFTDYAYEALYSGPSSYLVFT